jgi:magnesium chelatase family protein
MRRATLARRHDHRPHRHLRLFRHRAGAGRGPGPDRPGLPAFLLVGLPDKAVTESRERVRAALTGLGLSLPPKRVLVNLAPADILKEGSHYDLPIALALLAAMEIIPKEEAAGYAALGELSLDGAIMPVAGVLPAALGASERDLGLICPAAQGGEAAWAGRIEVLAAPASMPCSTISGARNS